MFTLVAGAGGAAIGVLLAAASWGITGRFLWYSWAFAPLVLGLAGVGLAAMTMKAAWFEKTPLYKRWTSLLGATVGRAAVYAILVAFVAVGITLGVVPMLTKRPLGSLDVPLSGASSEYEPILQALQSDSEEEREKALRDLDWHALPKRDIGPIRDRLREQLLRLAGDERVSDIDRQVALKALGKYGRPADLPALESLRGVFKKSDNGILVYWCEQAIEEIRQVAAPGG